MEYKMHTVNLNGKHYENGKIMRIFKRFDMNEIELQQAFAGDIVSIAGFNESTVGYVINEVGKDHVIESIPIDPPMLSLTITLNDSPLKGQDGDKLTIAQIRQKDELSRSLKMTSACVQSMRRSNLNLYLSMIVVISILEYSSKRCAEKDSSLPLLHLKF